MDSMDKTVKFNVKGDEKEASPQEILLAVYDALVEKEYHPINQIVGYLLSGDPAYIPRHNNARSLVRRKERDELIEELVRFYLVNHKVDNPQMKKKLGLDYGDRRIGVATSDVFGWTAQALETIERRGTGNEFERIRELVTEHEIGEIVVGLPKNMNGSVGPRGEICIEFADKLREQFAMPVHLWDERLTTVSAERVLIEGDVSRKKRKGIVDKMAAALILQNFLDANSKR